MNIGFDIVRAGDFAPENCLEGAVMALTELPSDVKLVLIGDSDVAKSTLMITARSQQVWLRTPPR